MLLCYHASHIRCNDGASADPHRESTWKIRESRAIQWGSKPTKFLKSSRSGHICALNVNEHRIAREGGGQGGTERRLGKPFANVRRSDREMRHAGSGVSREQSEQQLRSF